MHIVRSYTWRKWDFDVDKHVVDSINWKPSFFSKKSTAVAEKQETDVEAIKTPIQGKLWRDLVSYWIFGLCNNFGYVVMLTAAHSIIKELNGNEVCLKCIFIINLFNVFSPWRRIKGEVATDHAISSALVPFYLRMLFLDYASNSYHLFYPFGIGK